MLIQNAEWITMDGAPEGFTAEQIHAVVLHSEMTRTGWLESSDPMLNQLFSNIIWSQKGNYLDIPTDCPQRDERIRCFWKHTENGIRYEIDTPVQAEVIIGGKRRTVEKGKYLF